MKVKYALMVCCGIEFSGGGGLEKNDHEFPFLRIVELFERSLIMNQFHDTNDRQTESALVCAGGHNKSHILYEIRMYTKL